MTEGDLEAAVAEAVAAVQLDDGRSTLAVLEQLGRFDRRKVIGVLLRRAVDGVAGAGDSLPGPSFMPDPAQGRALLEALRRGDRELVLAWAEREPQVVLAGLVKLLAALPPTLGGSGIGRPSCLRLSSTCACYAEVADEQLLGHTRFRLA